jgi:hypothetical protein
MVRILLLSLLTLWLFGASAQKRTYFLFAHAKKRTEQICGEKELINNAEVSLTPKEAEDYRSKYLEQLRTKYNSANGYEYVYVELVPPGRVIIYYEGKTTFDQRTDGWNCTSTFYGCVTAADMLTAENSFNKLKVEYKKSTFTETKRWGKPLIESAKTDDLEIRWVQGKNKVVAFITNTRKDAALKVTIKSFKNMGGSLSVEGGFEKAKQVETHTLVLQPGARWNQNLENADGFEVDTAPAKIEKEEQGIIRSIKAQIKRYLVDPNGKVIPYDTGTDGSRG